MIPKKLVTFFIFTILLCGACLFATPYANTAFAVKTAEDCQKAEFFLLPTWYKHLEFDDNCSIQFSEQIINSEDGTINNNFDYSVIWRIGTALIEMLLMVAGFVALVFVMVGAFQIITSQGSPDKFAKARQTVTNGIVGAVIAILASRVVGYIVKKFGSPDPDNYGLVTASANNATITTLFNIALTALGAISVLVLIISGIQFIVSSGNPDKVAKARNAIYYALAGLIVAVFGAALINFIISRVV